MDEGSPYHAQVKLSPITNAVGAPILAKWGAGRAGNNGCRDRVLANRQREKGQLGLLGEDFRGRKLGKVSL